MFLDKKTYKDYIAVYSFTNKTDGKKYIGGTTVLYQRWHQHKNGYSNAPRFTAALKEFGFENFIFEIIEKCTLEELGDREEFWTKHFNTTDETLGYNIWEGPTAKRAPRTNEVKQQIRETIKEHFPEGRTNPMLGQIHSEETLKKIGEASKGRRANTRPVIAFNDKEKLEFACVLDASNLGIREYIFKALKSGQIYNGYYWKYKEVPKIIAFNDKERKEFISYNSAAKFIGERRAIQRAVEGGYLYEGYYWKIENP